MSDEAIVKIVQDGEIDLVLLNRPDRLNAINQPMAEALFAYFRGKARDGATRVILIAGEGRGFCSGADLRALGHPDALRDGPHGDWVLRDTLKAMRDCPQPVIALVHGAAAGGGLAIALAADFVLAGESAAFHPSFIKIGISASELGVSWRLQRILGPMRAREMLLTGRPMLAEEALAAGLVAKIVPDAALRETGLDYARSLLAASPDALRVSKRTFDATLEITSYAAALELEERGQIQMIRAGGVARGVPGKPETQD